ncbi:MAG: hypothetical protein JWP97_3496 [Labilithrix sp.]|nr:hypothetical protein [Labilithrix sp.]
MRIRHPRPAAPTLALIGAALAASGCVPDTAVRDAPARSSASASERPAPASAGAAVIAAPRTPVPEGPPRWKTVPRADNGFYAVVDGLCSELTASRVGSDLVVHYGGAGGLYAMYRMGDASFVALRDDGLESIGDPKVASPTGVAGRSLDDFWIADSTGTRSSEGAILHRYSGGVWKTYAKDQTNLHAWVDGGIIGSLGMSAANGELWVEGSAVKPPEALYGDMPYPALSAFPTGDILIVANKGEGLDTSRPLVARHWRPGGKITEIAVEKMLGSSARSFPRLAEIAPGEVYVFRDDRVIRWDGSAFHPLARAKDGKAIASVHRVGEDDLWIQTEVPDSDPPQTQLQHLTKDAATLIATPEPILAMDGVSRGAAWIVGISGKLYRREGESWKNMPLPSPVYSAQRSLKAKDILVVGPDDVILKAKYWEKGPGWTEQELHTALFRTRPVKETLRCNEPDPENNNVELGRGYQSWPPMATAECKTPFVVLARRSNARPRKDDDWPRLRAGLTGHPELGEVSLVELTSGGRTFVGTRARDLETARRIVQLVAPKDRLRPEIVCGDPEPTRTLAIDLKTGAATPR